MQIWVLTYKLAHELWYKGHIDNAVSDASLIVPNKF